MRNFSFSRRQQAEPANSANSIPLLPPSSPSQAYVRVSPLDGGQYTEPADAFYHPPDVHDPYAVITVPTLPFLIQHPGTTRFNRTGNFNKPCNILFDRGLRPTLDGYSSTIQTEIDHRHPIRLPDPITKQLSRGNLTVESIDLIILSHLHWSHTGDASSFSPLGLSYLIGPGSLSTLQHSPAHRIDTNTHLPDHRTIQLPHPGSLGAYSSDATKDGQLQFSWQPLGPLPYTIDIFSDGSVYAVSLPGHTQGHIGLLCRCGPNRWALLAGDLVHDTRLLTGEKSIKTWNDGSGREGCIHDDRRATEETLNRVRMLIEGQRLGGYQIEVIMSHDMDWVMKNLDQFWPGHLFQTSPR